MRTAKSVELNLASSPRRGRLKAVLRIFFAALSFASAHSTIAACAANYCDDVRILTLFTTNTALYVKVEGDMSQLNCARYGLVYATLSPTDSGALFKEQYATLLAHQLADRPVSFNIVPGSTGCIIASVYTNSP